MEWKLLMCCSSQGSEVVAEQASQPGAKSNLHMTLPGMKSILYAMPTRENLEPIRTEFCFQRIHAAFLREWRLRVRQSVHISALSMCVQSIPILFRLSRRQLQAVLSIIIWARISWEAALTLPLSYVPEQVPMYVERRRHCLSPLKDIGVSRDSARHFPEARACSESLPY